MFQFIQDWVLSAGAWGALGFFVGALLEEVAFPFPSPLLLIGVAFFFGKPLSILVVLRMLWSVILPIVVGATAGSLVIYGIAYTGGKVAIMRFGKRLGFTWEDVEKLRERLSARKSDELVLFLSRCLPFTPTTLITVIAGTMRMNVWLYTLLTFSGIFVRVTLLFIGALVFGHTIFK
ncbi:VTT domain-containing protein [Candidatus Parcubacteria bacterium]|nr:VTT domain-containing protein [Candidatus Parcubacteria bacterium]